ncbi:hypothetical protein AX16_009804 [Volvariella volvacea WC 439]|nr:hypothetical protein AX16_009804 [Volvariella volvacea WC 439]
MSNLSQELAFYKAGDSHWDYKKSLQHAQHSSSTSNEATTLRYISQLHDEWAGTTPLGIPAQWMDGLHQPAEPCTIMNSQFNKAIMLSLQHLQERKLLYLLSEKTVQERTESLTSIHPDFLMSEWRLSITDTMNHLQYYSGKNPLCYSFLKMLEPLLYAGTPGLAKRCLSALFAGTPHCWLTHNFPPSRSLINDRGAIPLTYGSCGFALVYQPDIPTQLTKPNLARHLKALAEHAELSMRVLCQALLDASSDASRPAPVFFGLLFNSEAVAIVAHVCLSVEPRTGMRPVLNLRSILIDVLPFGATPDSDLDTVLISRMRLILALFTLQRHAFRIASALKDCPNLPRADLYDAIHRRIDSIGLYESSRTGMGNIVEKLTLPEDPVVKQQVNQFLRNRELRIRTPFEWEELSSSFASDRTQFGKGKVKWLFDGPAFGRPDECITRQTWSEFGIYHPIKIEIPESWFGSGDPNTLLTQPQGQLTFGHWIASLRQERWFPTDGERAPTSGRWQIIKVADTKSASELNGTMLKLQSLFLDALSLGTVLSDESVFTLHQCMLPFFEGPFCKTILQLSNARLELPIIKVVIRTDYDVSCSKWPLLLALPCSYLHQASHKPQFKDDPTHVANKYRGIRRLMELFSPTFDGMCAYLEENNISLAPVPSWCILFGILYDEYHATVYMHYPLRRAGRWYCRSVLLKRHLDLVDCSVRTDCMAEFLLHLFKIRNRMIESSKELRSFIERLACAETDESSSSDASDD